LLVPPLPAVTPPAPDAAVVPAEPPPGLVPPLLVPAVAPPVAPVEVAPVAPAPVAPAPLLAPEPGLSLPPVEHAATLTRVSATPKPMTPAARGRIMANKVFQLSGPGQAAPLTNSWC
jgi:hypothetical protein